MIERLVFIATIFFFLTLGINGVLLMSNQLEGTNGLPLNLFGGTNELSGQNINSNTNNISYNTSAAEGISTAAPGQAQTVQTFTYTNNGISTQPGFLGTNWIILMVTGTQLVALTIIGLYPFIAPILWIYIGIASALEAFFLMYWAMAGARAILGRFL